jgi:hypothetical protein
VAHPPVFTMLDFVAVGTIGGFGFEVWMIVTVVWLVLLKPPVPGAQLLRGLTCTRMRQRSMPR